MRTTLSAAVFFSALTGLAHAADPASVKAPDSEPLKPSCFSSVWDYLNSSVRDCPLQYGPLALYGTLDGGYGYEQWGAPVGVNADKPNYAIQRNSGATHWLWSPNGLSTSTIGVRFVQKVFGEWEIIGVAEAGFNPYSFRLVNGPQSLADNNFYKTAYQRTAFDSARAGQWDNGQGFAGVSHPTYGTLTFGRTVALSQSAIGAYDPVASTAFSQIGFSASYANFGASPLSRINSAITYRLNFRDARVAFQAQIGGYDQDNAATAQYQAQVGFDYGKFSFDAIGGYARNAMILSSYGGATLPPGFDPDGIVKATLANVGGVELLAKYEWEKFKFYWGYIYARTTNPSDTYFPNGLTTIAQGVVVPPGAITANAYDAPRVQSTVWTGLRYALLKNLDLASGVYWEVQNNYLVPPATCTGSGTATSSGKCAGGRYSYSFLVDYRPTPRINLYAGVLFSDVYGGVANGYLHAENIAPTVGMRFRF
jgi:predicted porin